MLKKTLIILSIVIVIIAVISIFVFIGTKDNNKIDVGIVCPSVCVEMWIIQGNTCVFNVCGSGCGPDSVSTFTTQEQCITNIS